MAKKTWINISGAWRNVKVAWLNVGGVWKKITPKGNISGTWKDFIQYLMLLFDFGVQYITFGKIGLSSLYYGSNYISLFRSHYESSASIITTKSFDVTNFSKLKIRFAIDDDVRNAPSSYYSHAVSLSVSASGHASSNDLFYSRTNGAGLPVNDYEFDIKEIKGNVFLKVSSIQRNFNDIYDINSIITIYKVWLE